MSAEDQVREASRRFYSALGQMIDGNNDPMAGAWSHGANVTAMHPIGGRQVGWDEVRESFAQVGNLASGGEVALQDQKIEVFGDFAYEIGIEKGHAVMAGEQVTLDYRVTNIYRREGGEWRMIHHHADLSQPFVDLLKRLQAKG